MCTCALIILTSNYDIGVDMAFGRKMSPTYIIYDSAISAREYKPFFCRNSVPSYTFFTTFFFTNFSSIQVCAKKFHMGMVKRTVCTNIHLHWP